ncbi:MAG: hypothetical protein ACTTIP_06050 [Dialister pneumosintes]
MSKKKKEKIVVVYPYVDNGEDDIRKCGDWVLRNILDEYADYDKIILVVHPSDSSEYTNEYEQLMVIEDEEHDVFLEYVNLGFEYVCSEEMKTIVNFNSSNDKYRNIDDFR